MPVIPRVVHNVKPNQQDKSLSRLSTKACKSIHQVLWYKLERTKTPNKAALVRQQGVDNVAWPPTNTTLSKTVWNPWLRTPPKTQMPWYEQRGDLGGATRVKG